ncbi:hypothetical protein [Mucilaginibacter sp.]|uniref:hypothetical protein n=1 Tax=Mucilaginibacter sp. TaxID=1882438 RepID=UPI002851FE41|nr:hypothetical protein [Mucilaginibacter sp.]MDR3697113.1 hypothetical protein [Mucilaginibacter sp.]
MNFTINQTDFPAEVSVPVGTILPFIGSLNHLSDNWQPCDGRLIHNRQSPFNDQRVPNLVDDRFLMGVSPATAVCEYGGTNAIPDDGGHNHGGVTNGFGGYQPGEINYDRGPGRQDPFMMRFGIPEQGPHNHNGDNRPAFCGVYFIIRIF